MVYNLSLNRVVCLTRQSLFEKEIALTDEDIDKEEDDTDQKEDHHRREVARIGNFRFIVGIFDAVGRIGTIALLGKAIHEVVLLLGEEIVFLGIVEVQRKRRCRRFRGRNDTICGFIIGNLDSVFACGVHRNGAGII